MTALALTLTDAGRAAFARAQLAGRADLLIAQLSLSSTGFVTAPTLTRIPGEVRRLTEVTGRIVDVDTIHLMIRDVSDEAYTVRGFGLYLADGTLLAVYSQGTPIVSKSSGSNLFLALDLVLPGDQVATITFAGAGFTNPPATEDVAGVIELATQAEGETGTDHRRAVTPRILRAVLGALRYVRVTTSALRHRIYSDGRIECWGAVQIAAGATVVVPLPVPHTDHVIPVGSGVGSVGVHAIVGSPPTGFEVRNDGAALVTFYWHTIGV